MIYIAFMNSTGTTNLTRAQIEEVANTYFPLPNDIYVWDGGLLTAKSHTNTDAFLELLNDTFLKYRKTGLDFEWLETRYQLYKKIFRSRVPSVLVNVELCKHKLNGDELYLYRLTD